MGVEPVRGAFKLPEAHPAAWKIVAELYPIAERTGLPHVDLTLLVPLEVKLTLAGTEIVYKLYANCRRDPARGPLCVFYVAYNTHKKRNEFVIGPASLQFFIDHKELYCVAAGNFFGLTGYVSDHQISTGAMISHGLSGNVEGMVIGFGNSWAHALQDPSWWVAALGGAVSAGPRAAPARTLRNTAAARVTQPTSYPAVARALRTQANTQGQQLTRTVQLIEQPTVFRHTVGIQDIPEMRPYRLAQIEEAGGLRISTGGSAAHYGDGVYAWGPKAKGGARYIDIEVPPGTAAELLDVKNVGSWYRLLPPEGDILKVRIVGHNFTPDELAKAAEYRAATAAKAGTRK